MVTTSRQGRRSGKFLGLFLAAAGAVGGAAIAGFGPELWKWLFVTKPPIEYAVKVFTSADPKSPPIPQAAVELSIGTEHYGPNETDPTGVATIPLDAKNASKQAKLKVTRTGFEGREKNVTIPVSSAACSIYLDPVRPVSTAASPSPPPPQPAELTRVYSSGPKASGLGANYSEWYELCSEPPPAGYTIRTVQFVLEGDRSCGAWAECQETKRTSNSVCWKFRLQGHSEWFPPRPAFTQGILRVTFGRP
jgi:hypothetical protein